MRKLLLAGVIALAPVAAVAGSGPVGESHSASTQAGSTAGVASVQGTRAGVFAGGNGGVLTGAVSGNMTQVNTSALGVTGPLGSYTTTGAQQVNVGGTLTGGLAANKTTQRMTPLRSSGLQANGAFGTASGMQTSEAAGTSTASAANQTAGGFGKRQPSTR
jgi:hypothetical protein